MKEQRVQAHPPSLTVSLLGKHMFSRALLKWPQIYTSSHRPVFFQKKVCYTGSKLTSLCYGS